MTRGLSLLHELPSPTLRGDFQERLRHSLYSVDEAERTRRHRPHPATGGGAMAVAAAIAVVAAIAWTPNLFDATPSVVLPAIVVEAPVAATPSPGEVPAFGPAAFILTSRAPTQQARPSTIQDADLWEGAGTLLYEYSPLFERHRSGGTLIQTGLR